MHPQLKEFACSYCFLAIAIDETLSLLSRTPLPSANIKKWGGKCVFADLSQLQLETALHVALASSKAAVAATLRNSFEQPAMAFLKKLLDALKRDRTPYQPALLEFPPLDPVKLHKELKPQGRGAERGRRNEPPETAKAHDEIEHEILAVFEGFRAQAEASLSNNMEVHAGRLAKLSNETLVNSIDHGLQNAIADFRTGVRTDANRLYLLKKNVLEAEHEYQDFRRRNRLNRMAKYPAHWFKNISFVLLFALGDTVANAVFFSQTHPRGWLGAIFESVFISVVNVVVGVLAGYVLARGCHLRTVPLKAGSAVLLVAVLAFLLVGNIFAAHYRDAFASLSPESISAARDLASAEALRRLEASRWVLAGFQSYLMVIVGMVVALFALLEGYRLDDPLPGYGTVARSRQKHLAAYAEEKELLLRGLEERKNEALQEIDYLVQDIRRRDEEYATVLEARRTLIQRYNAFLDQLERMGNQLLETYRAANRSTRSDKAPATFAAPWSPGWAKQEVPRDLSSRDRAETTKKLTQRLADAPKAFLESYTSAVAEYQRIDQIVTTQALEHAAAQGQ